MNRTSSRRLLVVGDSGATRRLHESFQQLAPRRYVWLGIVADGPVDGNLGVTLGDSRDLAEIVSRHRPTDLVVALERPGLTLTKTLLQLAGNGVRLVDARNLREELTQRVAVLGDEDVWVTALARLSCRRWGARAVKRALDLLAAICAVFALAVVLFPVALALKLDRAGSVFVAERRVGRFGRPFTLLRFRTARCAPGAQQWPFVDPPPPTRTGEYIRRIGIDRLPQAFAILAGHLSLVGPRAIEPEYLRRIERESPVFLLRSAVKPGLTGWEQLHREGRRIYDTLRLLEYHLYYIKPQSISLDLRTLMRSALALFGLRRAAGN